MVLFFMRIFRKKRRCERCGQMKLLKEFRADKRGYTKHVCEVCEREYKKRYQKQWRKRKREEKERLRKELNIKRKKKRDIRAKEMAYDKSLEGETYVRCSLCRIRIGHGVYESNPVEYIYKEPKYIEIGGRKFPFDKDCYERAIIMSKDKLISKINAQNKNDSRFKENSR